MQYEYSGGNFSYDDEVERLLQIGPGPMNGDQFMNSLSARLEQQFGIIQSLLYQNAQDVDDGHRQPPVSGGLKVELAQLKTIDNILSFVLVATFDTVTPEEIIDSPN